MSSEEDVPIFNRALKTPTFELEGSDLEYSDSDEEFAGIKEFDKEFFKSLNVPTGNKTPEISDFDWQISTTTSVTQTVDEKPSYLTQLSSVAQMMLRELDCGGGGGKNDLSSMLLAVTNPSTASDRNKVFGYVKNKQGNLCNSEKIDTKLGKSKIKGFKRCGEPVSVFNNSKMSLTKTSHQMVSLFLPHPPVLAFENNELGNVSRNLLFNKLNK